MSSKKFFFYLVFAFFFSFEKCCAITEMGLAALRTVSGGAVDEWTSIAWWKIRAESLIEFKTS